MLGPEIFCGGTGGDDWHGHRSRHPRASPKRSMQRLADEEEDGWCVIGDLIVRGRGSMTNVSRFRHERIAKSLARRFYNSGALRRRRCHILRGLARCFRLTSSLPVLIDDLMLGASKDEGKSPLANRYHLRGDRRDNPEFVGAGPRPRRSFTIFLGPRANRALWC